MDHESDCRAWDGTSMCDCIQGARRSMEWHERRQAEKASAAAFARKPLDDAYARGRADERAAADARIDALEKRLAAMEARKGER